MSATDALVDLHTNIHVRDEYVLFHNLDVLGRSWKASFEVIFFHDL